MPFVPIPITKGLYQNVDSLELASPEYAAELKNIIINDAGSNVGRPCPKPFASVGSYPVIGLTFFANASTACLFAVTSDRRMWAIDAAGVVKDVTGDERLGGDKRPIFASDGSYLAIAGGGAPQQWAGELQISVGTEPAYPYHQTELLAGDPPDCDSIVYLDGYWILPVQFDQELRWAGPTQAARQDWNTANFFSAETLPDNIVTHAVLLRDLYVFGPTTTEVFRNYGDSSVPFRRLEGGFLDKGIAAAHSLAIADHAVAWLDSDRRITALQGGAPVQLSTPFDRVVRRMNRVDDCWAAVIDIDGHYLMTWTFPEVDRTFVFNYKTKEWSEWDGFRNGESSSLRMGAYAFAPDRRNVIGGWDGVDAWNRHFVGDPLNGTIYELSTSFHADGNSPRRILRQSGQIDHGTGNRKRSMGYRLHVKRGVGTPGAPEPVFHVRVNDDGKGWSPPAVVGLGLPGCEQKPIDIRMRGVYQKRQIEISMTDAAEFVLHKLEENVELLGS